MMGFRFLDKAIAGLEEATRYYEAVAMRFNLDLRDEVGRALQPCTGKSKAPVGTP